MPASTTIVDEVTDSAYSSSSLVRPLRIILLGLVLSVHVVAIALVGVDDFVASGSPCSQGVRASSSGIFDTVVQ
jgi:hypothetical protein